MNVAFFIARRIARSSAENRPGVMVRIAALSVALSMTVMILALAVIMGFKEEITRKVVGFAADAELTDIRSVNSLESQPIVLHPQVEALIRQSPDFASMSPYGSKGGILKTADAMQGVLLKGVDGTYDWSFLEEHLVSGTLPRVGDSIRTKDVLLAQRVADHLQLKVGDKIEMLFIEPATAPRRDRFKISGLYDSGMAEMDNLIMMTDLRNVQRLSGWQEDQVSGYEIRVKDFSQVGAFASKLNEQLLYTDIEDAENLAVNSVVQLYPYLFDWLRTHDVNAMVILVIMLVVALFNMASVLLILVLERTRMIGLLKALGMTNGGLQRLFLYRASFIVIRGVIWGNVVGLTLCLIQKYFHVMKLDATGYLLSEVPISLDWAWWLTLNVGVVAVIILLLTLPTAIISSIKPDESIRYN
ncbi:MAG: FtsX-like permease family protein [Alistipes sp.]